MSEVSKYVGSVLTVWKGFVSWAGLAWLVAELVALSWRRLAQAMPKLRRPYVVACAVLLVCASFEVWRQQGTALGRDLRAARDSVRIWRGRAESVATTQADSARIITKQAAEKQATIRVVDREISVRLESLRDSLVAIGALKPSWPRRPESAFYRTSKSFEAFLSPRDRMSRGVQGNTTHDLVSFLAGVVEDDGVWRALKVLEAITDGSDRTSLRGGVGWSIGRESPDTMVIGFLAPHSHDMERRPLAEVFPDLQAQRWVKQQRIGGR